MTMAWPAALFAAPTRSKRFDLPAVRWLMPLLLIPIGTAYCQLHEFLFEQQRSSVQASLGWASLTLMPWVMATMLFERLVRSGDTPLRLVRRAAVLAVAAYLLSAVGALILGSGAERAFYSRIPLIGAALLTAYLYRVPIAEPSNEDVGIDPEQPPIRVSDVILASAAGNYIELHSGARTFVWRQTMRNAERLLRPEGFVRVHRSYLVPWHSVERVTRGRKGPTEIVLRDGRRVPVSDRYAANVRRPATGLVN